PSLREVHSEAVERVLTVSRRLFQTYGLRTMTVDEIARHLGMSKRTLYQLFRDKNELVRMVVKQFIGEMQTQCELIRKDARDAIHETFQMFQYLDGIFRNLNPVVFVEMQRYHPDAFMLFDQHQQTYIKQLIIHNLKRGIQEGYYRADIHVEVIARFRLESGLMPLRQEIFPKDQFPLHEVQQELMLHYLYGIATIKGYQLIQQYRQQFNEQTNHRL
ncbi:MAG: TetR/AcrR family transcriptional regulator, partial [Thermoflavifilum sp.]|nr:TetR/AcrR family transcriptional regulator [Thermoflavifilum sp.]